MRNISLTLKNTIKLHQKRVLKNILTNFGKYSQTWSIRIWFCNWAPMIDLIIIAKHFDSLYISQWSSQDMKYFCLFIYTCRVPCTTFLNWIQKYFLISIHYFRFRKWAKSQKGSFWIKITIWELTGDHRRKKGMMKNFPTFIRYLKGYGNW